MPLHPWANGPFELILHAEGHLNNGEDFDRRIALISFDNAIEVSITTYLSLHPIQRGNRSYARVDVDRWLHNYHSKLDFLEEELGRRTLPWLVEKAHIIWVHDHRNEQYHGGNKGTPEKMVLELIRRASLWIFSVLFDVPDPEAVLAQEIGAATQVSTVQRDLNFDRAIDGMFGVVDVAGQRYYTSELLFSVDSTAYCDLGQRLCSEEEESAVQESGS